MEDRPDLVPTIEASEVESGLRLWWLGGPSYALKSPRMIIYVDPFHPGPGPTIRAALFAPFPTTSSLSA